MPFPAAVRVEHITRILTDNYMRPIGYADNVKGEVVQRISRQPAKLPPPLRLADVEIGRTIRLIVVEKPPSRVVFLHCHAGRTGHTGLL